MISDSSFPEYDSSAEYPSLLISSDLSGNLQTLYTYSNTSMPGPIVLHGTDVYFAAGLLGVGLARIDRAGGDPVVLVESLEAGPVRDDSAIYYGERTEDGATALTKLDLDTRVTEVVATTEGEVRDMAVDGDQLYWAISSTGRSERP